VSRPSPAQAKDQPEEAYFNKKVFLTVSGQLHLEALTGRVVNSAFSRSILQLKLGKEPVKQGKTQ